MGKDLTAWGASYYENIGVSFELPNHYQKMSGLENLNFFRRLYAGETEDPMKLLELVGLKEDANVRVSQYSKGMQMRLNFARALINKPKLLMLDEPTSGLDPVNARQIKDIIMGLKNEGRTIFLATHNMTVADELCDRVAFIVDGQISTIESPRTLKIKWGQALVRVEYRLNGHTEQRDYPLTGLAANNEFQQILAQDAIETLHSREATLEDVFIKVTGRELA
jgi:fluoroquinolone transport system ATP-binding protein